MVRKCRTHRPGDGVLGKARFSSFWDIIQSSVVNEDKNTSICDLRRCHSHWCDRHSGSVLAAGAFEIGRKLRGRVESKNLGRGLMPGAVIPAKGAGRNPRGFMDRALGADAPGE